MNIPEGFLLVPVEPTNKMVSAGMDVSNTRTKYQAMIAAAPPVELPAYDEAKERELFEAYASGHYRLKELTLDFDDGEYIESETQYSWEAWKACAQSRDGSVSDE